MNGLNVILKIGSSYLGKTNDKFIVIDSTFSKVLFIQDSPLKDSVNLPNKYVAYIKSRKAFVSDRNLDLQEIATSKYDLLADKVPDTINVFQFPDSTELHSSCRPQCDMDIINYDSELNSYWLTYDDSLKFDSMPRWAICIYNRLGQRLKFFLEPLPPKGWHYGIPLSVNQEGRIFRMLYHETEGISVVEYLWKKDLKQKRAY
ncbi:MAG: hypothetical protein JW699_00855 [Chitinispirillaceae bacterium]|nr:hypothetical protein [Chitinispirillaceae bacterium]